MISTEVPLQSGFTGQIWHNVLIELTITLILSNNKMLYCHIMFCKHVVSCLLNCIIETIQVTEGRKYLHPGPHVGQPWASISILCLSVTQLNTSSDKQTWLFSLPYYTYTQCNRFLLISRIYLHCKERSIQRTATQVSHLYCTRIQSKCVRWWARTRNRKRAIVSLYYTL
jgi:hypothetical protein